MEGLRILAVATALSTLGGDLAAGSADAPGAAAPWDSMAVSEWEGPLEAGVTPDVVSEWLAQRTSSSRRTRPLWAKVQWVSGHRRAGSLRGGWKALRIGLRTTERTAAGYAALHDLGVVEDLVVGGVRAASGEGVIIGRPPSVFSTPRAGPPRMGVGGSMSTWRRRDGVAIALRLGRNRIAGATWHDAGSVSWAAVRRMFAAGSFGVAGARLRSQGAPEVRTVSAFGGFEPPGGIVAGEVSLRHGEVDFALRAAVAGGKWGVEVSSGAGGGGIGEVTVASGERRRRVRAAVHHRTRIRNLRLRGAVFTLRQHADESRRRRLRAEIELRHSSPFGAVRLDARFDRSDDVELSNDVIVTGAHSTQRRLLRIRARFDTARSGPFGQRLGVTWIEPFTGDGYGMVTGWQGSVESGVLELRVAVHAFSLPAGVLGYVSRPGVAGYETVSVVSGTGSDLSVRTRMRIGAHAWLTVYAGMPRSGESRTYVALALEL